MKNLIVVLALVGLCVPLVSAQQNSPRYTGKIGAATSQSSDAIGKKIAKAAERQIVKANAKKQQKSFNEDFLNQITSSEGKCLLAICKDMRNIVAEEALTKADVEHVKKINDPRDDDGRLVSRLAQNYLTVLETNAPAQEKAILFDYLDSPIKVKFQQEPYTLSRGALYNYLSLRTEVHYNSR